MEVGGRGLGRGVAHRFVFQCFQLVTDSGHGAGSPRLTYASKGSLAKAEYCGLFEAWVRKVHRAPPPIHVSLARRRVAIGCESSSVTKTSRMFLSLALGGVARASMDA